MSIFQLTIKQKLIWLLLVPINVQAENQDTFKQCGLNQQARKLAALIINDPKQNRKTLVCNQTLSKIANKKAREMADSGRVTHRGRSSSNRRLINEGYPLSRIYPRMFENNVEAIAGGISKADDMWQAFKQSDSHRIHLLAEHPFYLLQNEVGVGFVKDLKSPHVEYWVVYIAHQMEQKKYSGGIAKSKD